MRSNQQNCSILSVKVVHWLSRMSAIALLASLLLNGAAATSRAGRDPEEPNLGICGMYYLSGRAAIDASGQLILLEEYCQTYRAHVLAASAPARDATDLVFWQNFAAVATPEAMQYAQTQNLEAVLEYGATICPLITETGSLATVRRSQSDGNLPRSFEVAVTIASIYTYCPNYQSLLGR